MKIAVLGQGRSGKTSFIEALLGQRMSKQCKVIDQSLKLFEYRSPLNENLVVTEISLPETNRIRDDMVKEIDFTQFDCFVILTSTWFTETSMWITSSVVQAHLGLFWSPFCPRGYCIYNHLTAI